MSLGFSLFLIAVGAILYFAVDASISGLGSIRVKEVTGSVTKSVSGGGSVKIGNRPS